MTHRILYQQYINSATTSCLGTPDIAIWKWSTLLTLKMFKGNKKNQVESNILWLRSTQQTKVYVVEAVAQRCSAKNLPWNISQNSQENACTAEFLKINLEEVLLPRYFKRNSCICVLLWIFKTLKNGLFMGHLWTATSVLGKNPKGLPSIMI